MTRTPRPQPPTARPIATDPPPPHTHLLFFRGPAVGWQDGYFLPQGAAPAVVLSGGQRIPADYYSHWLPQPPAPEETP